MVTTKQVGNYEILILRILPLAFAIPLMLRIFPLLPAEISGFFQFNVESFVYAVILFGMGMIGFIEMGYARRVAHETTLGRLSAGSIIMGILGAIGLILGTFVLIFGFTFTSASAIGDIIAWYMLIMVLVLFYGARVEIFQRKRLAEAFT